MIDRKIISSRDRMSQMTTIIVEAIYKSKIENELTYTEMVKVLLNITRDWSIMQLEEELKSEETGNCGNCCYEILSHEKSCPRCTVYFGIPPIVKGVCTRCHKPNDVLDDHICFLESKRYGFPYPSKDVVFYTSD